MSSMHIYTMQMVYNKTLSPAFGLFKINVIY